MRDAGRRRRPCRRDPPGARSSQKTRADCASVGDERAAAPACVPHQRPRGCHPALDRHGRADRYRHQAPAWLRHRSTIAAPPGLLSCPPAASQNGLYRPPQVLAGLRHCERSEAMQQQRAQPFALDRRRGQGRLAMTMRRRRNGRKFLAQAQVSGAPFVTPINEFQAFSLLGAALPILYNIAQINCYYVNCETCCGSIAYPSVYGLILVKSKVAGIFKGILQTWNWTLNRQKIRRNVAA